MTKSEHRRQRNGGVQRLSTAFSGYTQLLIISSLFGLLLLLFGLRTI